MNRMHTLRPFAAALLALSSAPALAHNGVEESAAHGGLVLASGAIHFEVARMAPGGLALYFSDGHGRPLPASAISEVAVEIEHPGAPTEYVKMAIDRTGGAWQGKSKPLTDGKAIVHIGYVYANKPALLDVPAQKIIAAAGKSSGKAHHGH